MTDQAYKHFDNSVSHNLIIKFAAKPLLFPKIDIIMWLMMYLRILKINMTLVL